MKSMADILAIVVGLLAFAAAIWQIMLFINARPDMWAGTNHLWLGILAAIVACICVVVYFVRHHKEVEEIHITDK